MANYQNNMRYGRMRTMYSQPWQNYNSMMTGNENCDCTFAAEKESQCCEKSSEDRGNKERRSEDRRDTVCSCQKAYESACESTCEDSLSEMPLAMAYVPWQKWCNIYEICKGFQRGTIFAELDKPFLGRGGCNR